jgi:hypothetical protein
MNFERKIFPDVFSFYLWFSSRKFSSAWLQLQCIVPLRAHAVGAAFERRIFMPLFHAPLVKMAASIPEETRKLLAVCQNVA